MAICFRSRFPTSSPMLDVMQVITSRTATSSSMFLVPDNVTCKDKMKVNGLLHLEQEGGNTSDNGQGLVAASNAASSSSGHRLRGVSRWGNLLLGRVLFGLLRRGLLLRRRW